MFVIKFGHLLLIVIVEKFIAASICRYALLLKTPISGKSFMFSCRRAIDGFYDSDIFTRFSYLC